MVSQLTQPTNQFGFGRHFVATARAANQMTACHQRTAFTGDVSSRWIKFILT
ncbi:MAG: hypothetical protein R3E39_00905 [Anaerolineae bacterium]